MAKNLLDPGSSPQSAGKPGVRRLNNVPLYIVLGVVSAGLIITGYVAMQKGKGPKGSSTDDHGGSASLYAAQWVGDREGGVIKPRMRPTPTPGALPVAYVAPSPTPNEQLDELRGERMRALLEALKAKSMVNDMSLSASKAQVQANDANQTSVKQTLASLKAADPNNFGGAGPDDLDNYRQKLLETQQMLRGTNGNRPADPNNLSMYAGDDSPDTPRRDRWKLNTQLEPPSTPYLLRTGFVIPAILISAMDSELPGTIIAQVSQNVYDTATGNYLLIPQGSRLVGAYTNSIGYGQSRVFVAWQRIVYPDASALDLGAMPGTDEQGEAGFHDLVDNHFVRLFGSALLMSAITAGVTWSQGANNVGYNGSFSAGDALSQALGQELGMTMSEMIRRNMSIAPTLNIRPGYRFNVLVTKDITFEKPYTVPNY